MDKRGIWAGMRRQGQWIRVLAVAVVFVISVALPVPAGADDFIPCTDPDCSSGYDNQDPDNVAFPSFDLPYWSNLQGWGEPEYYRTIMTGDLDGDGSDEILARSSAGVVVWKYHAQYGYWMPLVAVEGAAAILADAQGWNQEKYYLTMRVGDIDGDGAEELVARGPEGIVAYKAAVLSGTYISWTELAAGPAWSDEDGWGEAKYYSTIRLADIEGSGKKFVLGRYSDGLHAAYYDPSNNTWGEIAINGAVSDGLSFNLPQYYSTLCFADVNGDGAEEMMIRGHDGMITMYWSWADQGWFYRSSADPAWADVGGWNQPWYYETIQPADVNGDGVFELTARGADGVYVYRFSGGSWTLHSLISQFSDDNGWSNLINYPTIGFADLDGDGDQEAFARHGDGLVAYYYNADSSTPAWTALSNAPPLSDDNGWNLPRYYLTLQAANVDGDSSGQHELLIRSASGMRTYRYSSQGGGSWPMAAAPFPDYANGTKDQQKAYNTILDYCWNQGKSLPQGVDLRRAYSDLSVNWNSVKTDISSVFGHRAAGDIPPLNILNAVKAQLLVEVGCMINITSLLQDTAKQTLIQLFQDCDSELTNVPIKVKHLHKDMATEILVSMMTDAMKDALFAFVPEEEVVAEVGKAVGEAIVSGILEHTEACLSDDESVDMTVGEISENMKNWFNSNIGKLDTLTKYIGNYWGMMQVMNQLAQSQDYVSAFDSALGPMTNKFALSLYKSLMPLVYRIVYAPTHIRTPPECWDGAGNDTYLYHYSVARGTLNTIVAKELFGGFPDDETMEDIFHRCGADRENFFISANGWNFSRAQSNCNR